MNLTLQTQTERPAEVLRATGLKKRYGGIVVADSVDVSLTKGRCLGVIGPNGAGKTSLFGLLDGTIQPDGGSISLGGKDITQTSKPERARAGIARAFQVPQPFPQLSVFENVLASATFGAGMKGQEADKAAAKVLELTGLWQNRQQPAGSLPLLSRKRLELAKALAVRPKVLLLDEIAGGLTEPEVHELVKLILSLKKDFAIMWIEHVAHALVAVADSIMVLHFGKKLAEGDPKEVMASSEVREIYMGVTADAAAEG